MDRLEFTEGTRVVGSDGVAIGTVESVDAAGQPPMLLVRLDDSDEIAGVPAREVDFQRSTGSEIRLMILGSDVLHLADSTEVDETGQTTIPLHAEVLEPHVREARQGRVLIHKRVETHPVEEQVELEHEVVEIERVPIGEEIDAVPAVRQEGDTTIVPVVEEILIVEKRLRLVEEVRITKKVAVEIETIRDDLRREVIDVEEEPEADRRRS